MKGPVDGIEAAIRLHSRHKASIIFVTGLATDDMRQRMDQVSTSAALVKPFTDQDLRGALVWACGQTGARAVIARVSGPPSAYPLDDS